jgi:DNA-binding response OmpR family regulator
VLLVDGHVEMLALYSMALSAMGFDVARRATVPTRFARALQMHPDIIITDGSCDTPATARCSPR